MSSYLKLNSTENTYIVVPNDDSFNPGPSSFCIACWCRFSNISVSMTLFHRFFGADGYSAVFNQEINGNLSLEFNSRGTFSRIENVPIKIDEWQFFVFVETGRYDSRNIYIDGVLHADTYGDTSFGAIDINADLFIGKDPDNPSVSQIGNIDIDGFSFHKGGDILTESQIRSMYNRGRGRKIVVDEDNYLNPLTFGLNLDEGTGTTVTDVANSSLTGTIISDASPFDNVWSETGGVAVMLPSDIKMYLTSLEPDIVQTNYAQSIGGHISPSYLYPETTLASMLGLYGDTITLTDATDLVGSDYISLRSEIAKVETISNTNVTVTERGVNDVIGYYPSDTVIQGVIPPFNDSFNGDRKQYRCYAVKNVSTTEKAFNVIVYFKQLSSNANTTIRLALESPKSQKMTGVSTRWTSSMLVDSSLAGTYADNWFSESYMTFEDSPNANERIRILSYDGATGTFVFADSIATDFDPLLHSTAINYTIDASPAQRVKSGTDAPADTDFITDFSEAIDRENSVKLNSIKADGELLPGEIIYIWVEREIGKSNDSYDENSFVLSIDFSKEREES